MLFRPKSVGGDPLGAGPRPNDDDPSRDETEHQESNKETSEERRSGQVYDSNAEYFVDLADGTDFNLGHEPWKVTIAELQEKLQSLGKPTRSEKKISELRENGWIKEEEAQ